MMTQYDYIQSFSVYVHIPCYLTDPRIHFLTIYEHQNELIASVQQGLSCCKSCMLGKRNKQWNHRVGETHISFLETGEMDRALSYLVTEHMGAKEQGMCQWNF